MSTFLMIKRAQGGFIATTSHCHDTVFTDADELAEHIREWAARPVEAARLDASIAFATTAEDGDPQEGG